MCCNRAPEDPRRRQVAEGIELDGGQLEPLSTASSKAPRVTYALDQLLVGRKGLKLQEGRERKERKGVRRRKRKKGRMANHRLKR